MTFYRLECEVQKVLQKPVMTLNACGAWRWLRAKREGNEIQIRWV
jgi:hypothetical protein